MVQVGPLRELLLRVASGQLSRFSIRRSATGQPSAVCRFSWKPHSFSVFSLVGESCSSPQSLSDWRNFGACPIFHVSLECSMGQPLPGLTVRCLLPSQTMSLGSGHLCAEGFYGPCTYQLGVSSPPGKAGLAPGVCPHRNPEGPKRRAGPYFLDEQEIMFFMDN